MQFNRSFVDLLSAQGLTVVSQPAELRPLDLIGTSLCKTYGLGPIEQLVGSGMAVLPPVKLGTLRPDIGKLATDWAPAGIAATFLYDWIAALGGQPAYCTDFTNAEAISILFPKVTEDRVSVEALREYLESAKLNPGNLIIKEFVLSGADVYVITSVLKATEIGLHLMNLHGLPQSSDSYALAAATGLDVGSLASGWGLTLRGRRSAVLGIECSRLALSYGRLSLAKAQAPLPGLQGGLLPPLEHWIPGHQPFSRSRIQVEVRAPYHEYVLVPDRGVRLDPDRQPETVDWFRLLHDSVRETVTVEEVGIPILVLDSIAPFGPKLVQLSPLEAAVINGAHLGWKLRPVVLYRLAAPPRFDLNPVSGLSGAVKVHVQCASTGQAVEGVEIIGITDWANQIGARAVTDAQGDATLALGSAPVIVERLYCVPPLRGFWGAYRTSLQLSDPHCITLEPVRPGYTDGLRYAYGNSNLSDGQGVKVAVIDTGIGPHPDLVVCGGENVLDSKTEPRGCYEDNGIGHGTHVAGIIAARGTPPQSVRGLAPCVELYSYRVFGSKSYSGLRNYLIAKALWRAIDEQCDVGNLSLGPEYGAPADETLEDAIKDARDHGCVLVAAAGNGGRQPVGPLAGYVSNEGFCVSATGRRGTFPAGSLEESDFDLKPRSTIDPNDFVAEFSNIGKEISVTAPGVGIISTAINLGVRPLSGTSMAAAVVTGVVARVIFENSPSLPTNRDASRVRVILQLALNRAHSLGFPFDYEGRGLSL